MPEKVSLKRSLPAVLFALAGGLSLALAIRMSGFYLPSWVNWQEKETRIEAAGEICCDSLSLSGGRFRAKKDEGVVFETPAAWRVSDYLCGDIDSDGEDEILLLVWKRGSFGEAKPFWIKENDSSYSQHIFIYETDPDRLRPSWMSSALGRKVADWSLGDDGLLRLKTAEGAETAWAQHGFGLIMMEEEKEEEEASLSLFVAGDNLIHETVMDSCYREESDDYDFAPLYWEVAGLIEEHDIAVVNQETILTANRALYAGFPRFATPTEAGDALAEVGFDVVLAATNHANDQGQEGLSETLAFWEERHPEVRLLGLHRGKRESGSYDVLEARGIRLALFNYTFSLNGLAIPDGAEVQVDQLQDRELLLAGLAAAEGESDLSVCFFHIGEEYDFAPTGEQRELAEAAIDAGADLIFCAHSHVIAPCEEVTTAEGNRGLVFYGLGNFVSAMMRPEAMLEGAASVVIEKDAEGARVASYRFLPLVNHYAGGQYLVLPLENYTEELAAEHALNRDEECVSPEILRALWEEHAGSVSSE